MAQQVNLDTINFHIDASGLLRIYFNSNMNQYKAGWWHSGGENLPMCPLVDSREIAESDIRRRKQKMTKMRL